MGTGTTGGAAPMAPMTPGAGTTGGMTPSSTSAPPPPFIYGTTPDISFTSPIGFDNTSAPYATTQNMSPYMPSQQGPYGMQPGMQPGMGTGMQPVPAPYFYPTGQMPYPNYPTYQGLPNMYLPNMNPYGTPMGIPLYPLYGYDNSADLDKDAEYLKQLYPATAKAIQHEIENECDQMEYDGSQMFDEYPDKEYINKIVDRVYDKVKDMDEEPMLEASSLYFYPPRRSHNHLRDIVSLLLLSELFNRRRRYRSRRRWF
jgi:hypothetical protein